MAGSPEQQEPIGLNSGYLTHQRQEREKEGTGVRGWGNNRDKIETKRQKVRLKKKKKTFAKIQIPAPFLSNMM